MNKNALMAIAFVLLLSTSAFALPNRVKWNSMLEECVYYYTPQGAMSAHCYVDEENCDGSMKTITKNVDTSTCYYVPRKEQAKTESCQEFIEGDLIELNYAGSDPDKDVGPAGKLLYTVGKPFDANNKWQTKRGDAGTYNVEVTVSDGQYQDKDTVCFRVLKGNKAPTLTVKDVTVDEGDTIKLRPTCDDPDGDALQIVYTGAMTSDTWQTSFDDAGTYKVTVTCKETTGDLKDQAVVTVTVKDVNRAPALTTEDVTVSEGETVRLKSSCADPEKSMTKVAYSGHMKTDTWATSYSDAGTYKVHVTCTDPTGLKDETDITVTVVDRNRPPSITAVVKRL